jgi:TPP-dependent pyruvate/acetoin dehydrogenase alpha subunit
MRAHSYTDREGFVEDQFDPTRKVSELDLDGLSKSDLFSLYECMVLVRSCELKLAKNREAGEIRGPVHLSVGQEAVPAAIAQNLKDGDLAFGAHRSHGHILAMGTDVGRFFSEVLARKDGLCGGKGGSMHLSDIEKGFVGSVPIVAGSVPLAVGAALSFKSRGIKSVVVSYLGDGAMEEGVVYESMNLAAMLDLPVVFVCENNFYASHMSIKLRQPKLSTTHLPSSLGIKSLSVDGNDVTTMVREFSDGIHFCRQNSSPLFIEAITYRWFGHVDWREDIDVGLDRSAEDLRRWKLRDPIARLAQAIEERDQELKAEMDAIVARVNKKVDLSWSESLHGDSVDPRSLLENVYA